MVKEFVSKIQSLRKDSDFEVVNHIKIELSGDKTLIDLLLKYERAIKKGTLCDEVKEGSSGSHSMTFDYNSKQVEVKIAKI